MLQPGVGGMSDAPRSSGLGTDFGFTDGPEVPGMADLWVVEIGVGGTLDTPDGVGFEFGANGFRFFCGLAVPGNLPA